MATAAFRQTRIALRLGICFILPVATGAAVIEQRTTWSFDDLPAGRPPPGFVFVSALKDQAVQWGLVRDGTNGVLGQLGKGQSGVQLAVAEGTLFGDLVLSARLRFMEGARSAGLVWRYRDQDNYYLATLDLREQEIRIYRVVAGNRTRLADEDDLELDEKAWHLLKIEHRGARVRVWINGVPASDARDRTFQERGGVGLWTTGDTVAWFDDLFVEPALPDRGERGDPRD
jgi:hypothetical protein